MKIVGTLRGGMRDAPLLEPGCSVNFGGWGLGERDGAAESSSLPRMPRPARSPSHVRAPGGVSGLAALL